MVDTRQPAALAIIGVSIGASTLCVFLRILARLVATREGGTWDRSIKWSDGILFSAYLLVAGESYVIIECESLDGSCSECALLISPDTLHTYQGYHIADIPKLSIEELVLGQRYNIANQLLYNPILSLVKASVVIFLLHLGGAKPLVRHSLNAVFIINALLATAIFITTTFQCTPFHYTYDYPAMDLAAQIAAGADSKGKVDGVKITGGVCINQINFFLISAGFTIITDLMVLVIPMVILWDLRIRRRKKIFAIVILSMGGVVTCVSIARLIIYSWRFSPDNKDRSYGAGYTISAIEANLAICAACAPSLGPLLRRFAPILLESYGSGSSSQTPHQVFKRSRDVSNGMYELESLDDRDMGDGGNVRARRGNLTHIGHTDDAHWESNDHVVAGNAKHGLSIMITDNIDVDFDVEGDSTHGRGVRKQRAFVKD